MNLNSNNKESHMAEVIQHMNVPNEIAAVFIKKEASGDEVIDASVVGGIKIPIRTVEEYKLITNDLLNKFIKKSPQYEGEEVLSARVEAIEDYKRRSAWLSEQEQNGAKQHICTCVVFGDKNNDDFSYPIFHLGYGNVKENSDAIKEIAKDMAMREMKTAQQDNRDFYCQAVEIYTSEDDVNYSKRCIQVFRCEANEMSTQNITLFIHKK